MIIYFDESYDHEREYLILAALFNPHSKYLHRRLREAKGAENFYKSDGSSRELKYSKIKNDRSLRLAKKAIDIFMESTSWFRCIVITQKLVNLSYFGKGKETDSLKYARLYKKFAELLIGHNTRNVLDAVLFADKLTRCKGDEFVEVMKQEFCIPFNKYSEKSQKPTLKDVMEIDSDLEQYHVNQINDILAGCVLNNLKPSHELKNNLREYLITKLGVKNLLPETWSFYSKKHVELYYPKFNIWFWKPSK